jgi:hypothetical protein
VNHGRPAYIARATVGRTGIDSGKIMLGIKLPEYLARLSRICAQETVYGARENRRGYHGDGSIFCRRH